MSRIVKTKHKSDTENNQLRHVNLENGYTLRTWWCGNRMTPDGYGPRPCVGYVFADKHKQVIFSGEDYFPAVGDAIDDDESLRGLLAFFTREGTDYTPEQKAFAASSDAEDLDMIYCVEPDNDDDKAAFIEAR